MTLPPTFDEKVREAAEEYAQAPGSMGEHKRWAFEAGAHFGRKAGWEEAIQFLRTFFETTDKDAANYFADRLESKMPKEER